MQNITVNCYVVQCNVVVMSLSPAARRGALARLGRRGARRRAAADGEAQARRRRGRARGRRGVRRFARSTRLLSHHIPFHSRTLRPKSVTAKQRNGHHRDARASRPLLLRLCVGFASVSRRFRVGGECSYVGLARDDGAAAIAAQWGALRAAFLRPDAALIFHLKNHYALVFALREWSYEVEVGEDVAAAAASAADGAAAVAPPTDATTTAAEPRRTTTTTTTTKKTKKTVVVRQLLTSRRGQRPSAWVDWREARETMLGWDGYKMMLVEKETASS